jgi:hypothetical protein
MDWYGFSGTNNGGCESPVNALNSLITDWWIIKIKGRQLLVIRRLTGDVVVNDGRFGRVGEASC